MRKFPVSRDSTLTPFMSVYTWPNLFALYAATNTVSPAQLRFTVPQFTVSTSKPTHRCNELWQHCVLSNTSPASWRKNLQRYKGTLLDVLEIKCLLYNWSFAEVCLATQEQTDSCSLDQDHLFWIHRQLKSVLCLCERISTLKKHTK